MTTYKNSTGYDLIYSKYVLVRDDSNTTIDGCRRSLTHNCILLAGQSVDIELCMSQICVSEDRNITIKVDHSHNNYENIVVDKEEV